MTGYEGAGWEEDYELHSRRLREISLDGAYGLLAFLSSVFDGVRKHYAGRLSTANREIGPDDLRALSLAIDDLLPLGLNNEVQAEVLSANPHADNSSLAFYRITALTNDIMMYLTAFENAGVSLASAHVQYFPGIIGLPPIGFSES